MVSDFIQKSVESQERLLTEISRYVIDAGGKRMRPMVSLLAFHAVGGTKVEEVVKIAAALELVHTATLLHDDINDGSSLRRGKEAAYRKFGTEKTIVTGDFLFTQAFSIGGMFDNEIVSLTAEACIHLAEGEMRQQIRRGDLNLGEDEYIDIIRRKTAWPISIGARIGAILGGGDSEEVLSLGEYGAELGVAFQLVDDILDVTGDDEILGKPTGTDVRDGTLTLLTIHALRNAPKGQVAELGNILKKGKNTRQKVERALEIIIDSGAVDAAREKAREFGEAAKAKLGPLRPTPQKLELLKLVDLILQRHS